MPKFVLLPRIKKTIEPGTIMVLQKNGKVRPVRKSDSKNRRIKFVGVAEANSCGITNVDVGMFYIDGVPQ